MGVEICRSETSSGASFWHWQARSRVRPRWRRRVRARRPIGSSGIPGLLDDFLALPGNKSAQLDVDAVTEPWRVTHDPDVPLFCGSAFKTFVLATYLQEVEAERLSESEQLVIDDSIRSVGGGVFEHLSGTTEAATCSRP